MGEWPVKAMMTFVLAACAVYEGVAGHVAPRWSLADGGTRIVWNVREEKRLPHRDMLEMSGLQASLVLSYEIDADRKPNLNRFVLWPQYRTQPNDTHAIRRTVSIGSEPCERYALP